MCASSPCPLPKSKLYADEPEPMQSVLREAMRCRFCEHPSCCGNSGADIPGILRRVAVGNIAGAAKCYRAHPVDNSTLKEYEKQCIRSLEGGEPVEISRVIAAIVEDLA